MAQYAVAWQDDDGLVQTGRLDVNPLDLRLEGGRHRSGRLAMKQVLYRDLTDVGMAPMKKRVQDRPTTELRTRHGCIYVAPVGAGVARELLELLQRRLDTEAS